METLCYQQNTMSYIENDGEPVGNLVVLPKYVPLGSLRSLQERAGAG